ncbi:diguanylate cyclase [Luminiphilus syltensis NOR5-1B]|uniref:diguanylate cyclase n=1 Tax=Luminiphilus syltensis NOR5-1B TaxID=565045 RepID=B8KWC0_9GAMM|nr:diguanylate cyclase [Luminiphilus syltensis]EED34355.1 diguanylate cyclase [Luminiphilus syltensis NOR5-1B]
MLYQRKIEDKALLAAKLDLQVRNARFSSVGVHLIGVAAMMALLWFQLPQNLILTAAGTMVAVLLVRTLRMTQAQHKDWAHRYPVRLLWEMTVGALVTGMLWSGAIFWLDGYLPDQWFYVAVLIAAFIAIVAVSVMTIVLQLYLAYLFSTLVPMASWLAFHYDARPYNLIIAAVMTGLAVILSLIGGWMSRSFAELVKVNLERTAMAQDLSDLTASLRVRNLQLQEARKQLSEMATVDELTGLRNRRAVNRLLDVELARSKRSGVPIGLVMIDVDHFKLYNDTYGHPDGDEVLQQLAEVLMSVTSRAGEMAARMGGEEFILVLPGSTQNKALNSAEMIRERFNALQIPHKTSLTAEFVTVSQGVLSCVPNLETRGEALISAVDKALYESKQRGRNAISLSTYVP